MMIERNFKKNPHTARWLMTFHSAGGTNLGGAVAERPIEEDLLDLVADVEIVDHRSPAQAKLMTDLILAISELDAEAGALAQAYTARMTVNGRWTAGREGNASAWITRMIAKEKELKAAARGKTAPAAQVPDGRYAVEEDGVLKFFKVTNGRVPGFVFLDIQASSDWHSIRNVARIRAVVALIAADADGASLRYGQEIGECGDCGRTLTTEASRARGRGPICDAKH